MRADQLYQLLPIQLRRAFRRITHALARPRLATLYAEFVHDGDLVFDVGANIGEYTELFLELGAQVIAVDPQPYCIAKLRKKFADDSGVTIVGQGLDQRQGEATFHISTENRTTSSFSKKFRTKGPFSHREWDKEVEVPITTLDALIETFGRPTFCKIDVEGYEANVLEGLTQRIPVLSFEFSSGLLEETRRCIRHLNTLGEATYNFAQGPSPNLRLETWVTGTILLSRLAELEERTTGDVYVRYT